MDTINKDMKEAERHLTQLEKCCGCCTCPWQKVAPVEDKGAYASTYNTAEGVITNEPATATKSAASRSGGAVSGVPSTTGGGVAQITRIADDEREDEMEQNLG